MQTNIASKKTAAKSAVKTAFKASLGQAREEFAHHVASARELSTLLRRHLDDHMEVAPDEVDWANVGDAAHLVELLKEAARFCNLIGE